MKNKETTAPVVNRSGRYCLKTKSGSTGTKPILPLLFYKLTLSCSGKLVLVVSVVVLLQQCTHGDGDPLVFDVDVNDLYPYNVTNGNDVLDIFHTLVSQLRNVNQTVYTLSLIHM